MLNILDNTRSSNDFMTAPARSRLDSVVRDGFVTMTAGDAAMVLANCRYPQKRDIVQAGNDHKQVLAEIMKRGNWRAKDKIDFARVNGKLLLLNGHHRLGGQAMSGKSIEWTIVIHDCKTQDEAEALYYSFDTNTRARSNATILNAISFDEKLGVSKSLSEALYRAAPFLASGLHFGRVGRDVLADRLIDRRLDAVLQFAEEARIYEKCIASAPPRVKIKLLTAGALTVALVTIRHRREAAVEFWTGVAENDGLRKGDPRHTYLNALMSNSRRGGMAAATACLAALAWRHYYNGTTCAYLRVVESPQPAIAGTPYKGR